MKNLKQKLIIFFIIIYPTFSFAESFKGRVVGVSDGDTISVLNNGKAEKIRLSYIDCPEKRQAFGTQAKLFTSHLVFGKDVEVKFNKRDRYGRILGQVFINRNDLGETLLKNGLAWHYTHYSNDARLQMLEDHARLKRIGLWQDIAPIPPWIFRKMGR